MIAPNRQERRRNGKSDAVDAIEAARAALSGRASGIAKTADGNVEAIRALLVAQRSARDVRIKYLNQIRHLGFTAPMSCANGSGTCPASTWRARPRRYDRHRTADSVLHATKLAIRTLGRRVLALEARQPTPRRADPSRLVQRTAPSLLAVYGVGVDTAAILLVAAGDNPHRLRSEAALAHLCGVAPLPASSGKTQHGIGSTAAGTVKRTMRCGGSCSPA